MAIHPRSATVYAALPHVEGVLYAEQRQHEIDVFFVDHGEYPFMEHFVRLLPILRESEVRGI